MSDPVKPEGVLFELGPPVRVQTWLGLAGPGDPRIVRRVILAVLVGWLPLVVLTAMDEGALRSFSSAFGVHAGLLVAVPLFIVADAVCGPRLAAVAFHFLDAGFVPQHERARFDAAIAATRRLLGSAAADVAVIVLAYAIVAFVFWWEAAELWPWHKSGGGPAAGYSAAGWWHILVSVPLLLVVFLGWIWRLFLWTRFLWRVSRLDLRLLPSHPDRAAGLKFVGYSVRGYCILGFALGAILAGSVANGVFNDGVELVSYKYAVGGLVVFVVVLFNAPLLVFTHKLLREWQRGVFEYGALADAFGRQFERRWLRHGDSADESILERPDFSAATDLYQVVDRVHEMRLVPFDVKSVVLLVLATLLPFVPVALLAMPFDVIVSGVAGMLF